MNEHATNLSGAPDPPYFRDLDQLHMAKLHLAALGSSILLLPVTITAQTFTGDGGNIPDDGTVLQLSLDVGGLPSALDIVSFGLEQVCFTIEHTWLDDVKATLVAPDGTAVLLTSGLGGNSDHYTNTCFRSDATLGIAQGEPPFSGAFRPMESLSAVNNGQDGNGTWVLHVEDTYPYSDAGSVISWSLTFGNDPAAPFTFQSSNLPIVVVNTNGANIPQEGKIPAEMGIVYNGPGSINLPVGPFNEYDGPIGIELHGSSSSSAPKKSYSFEFRDELGEDLNVPILGMPAGSDWLLVANYFDKSLMNNTLSYHLGRAMGHYAPRHRNVEVVVNGTYVGVYALVERIKRGSNRLDLAKLRPDEVSGDDVTGGYIISIDRYWGSGSGFASGYDPPANQNGQQVFFRYRYPKADKIVPEQKAYIQAYVDSFETALAGPDFADTTIGYRAYADVNTFIDLFLLNELSRNVDGYRLSTYLHKDKDSRGGKLRAGPPWDYDLAWGNANYCDGSSSSGWSYLFGEVCPYDNFQVPFWWSRFMEDSAFVDALHCRWLELRDNLLSPAYISAYCDSVAAQLEEAQQRNFTVWPILGTYVWPNPEPIPTTYAGEVQELKDFVNARWAWLDANMPTGSACLPTSAETTLVDAIGAVHPNPFGREILFHATTEGRYTISLIDFLGRPVLHETVQLGPGQQHRLQVPSTLATGTYTLVARTEDGAFSAVRVERQ